MSTVITQRKGLIKWMGGKTRLASWLLNFVPEHKTYIEPFCGSCALLLAKDPVELEIINDLHEGIVNLFRVVRSKDACEEIKRKCFYTPYSRQEFYAFRDSWRNEKDPIEKAFKFLYVAKNAFSGDGARKTPSYGVVSSTKSMPNVIAWASIGELIDRVRDRIKHCVIEHTDFRNVIKRYIACEDAFMYLDPPYVCSDRELTDDYEFKMTEDDHKELVDLALTSRAKILISGFEHPIYDRLTDNGWIKITRDRKVQAVNNRFAHEIENRSRTECLWMNYEPNHDRDQLTMDQIR